MWFTAGARGDRASIGVPGVPGAYYVSQTRRGASVFGLILLAVIVLIAIVAL